MDLNKIAATMADNRILHSGERIERTILLVRGHELILDTDLADLFGVETKVLNRALARNRDRFPSDFAFHLNRRTLKT